MLTNRNKNNQRPQVELMFSILGGQPLPTNDTERLHELGSLVLMPLPRMQAQHLQGVLEVYFNAPAAQMLYGYLRDPEVRETLLFIINHGPQIRSMCRQAKSKRLQGLGERLGWVN